MAQSIALTLESATDLLPYGLLVFINAIGEIGIRRDTCVLKINNSGSPIVQWQRQMERELRSSADALG